jgi:hypothetical protein
VRWSQGEPALDEMGEDFVARILPGRMKVYKTFRVMDISPDLAMRYAHIFDTLPPLYQTTCKVVALATLTGFFQLPVSVLWAVLNDLIESGVEGSDVEMVIQEMVDMYIIQSSSGVAEREVMLLSPVSVEIWCAQHLCKLVLMFVFPLLGVL